MTPGAYLANSVYAAEDRQAQIPEFGNVYNIYCQRCKRNGAMDFDDLLLQTNILLRDAPDVLARYQELFKYILVDEYQDTNYAQYVIIRRLSQLHSKVCVVGDDAQSIYSFRGAKIENILSFQKDFPAAKVFKLEQNYRSTRTIVDAANSVIVRNSRRMEKHCFSAGDVGEPIRILKAYTDREEAEMVVSDLRDKVRSTGDDWSEAVILYRTNNQSAVLEDNLRRRGIPYRIYKGSSFYDHKEVKDMLAYIRLVINPRDDEAFKRIVNYPTRGIGDTTVQRIAQLAAERGVSMWEAVDALVAEPAADPVQKTIARKVADFVAMIRSLSLARNEKGLYDQALWRIKADARKLGSPAGQGIHRYAYSRQNHAADVLLVLIHHADGGCRSHIDQNERHRIPVDSRDGTDDQIGTDGGWIVHQHFQTDIHIHVDNQGFLPRHLADRLPHQGCNRRYHRTDDRAGDFAYLDFPQLQHHFQGNRIVKLCFPAVCRHPLGKEDFPIRNTTENHIRISDIQCQNHTVLPPAFFQSRYKFCPVKRCADCTGEDCGRYHLAYCIDSYETAYEQDDIFSADQPLHIFGIAKQND